MSIKQIFPLFSMVIFILILGFLNYDSNKERELIWEPDDHYSFLNKSQMYSCDKNCKYIENFYDSILNSNAEKFQKERQINRILNDYSPAYTFSFILINKIIKVDQKKLFFFINIFYLFIGSLFIYLFIKSYFNYKTLVIGLIILPLISYPYFWGIHYFTPNMFSMLIFLFGLYFINSSNEINANKFRLIIIIGNLFHPISTIYNFILIMLTFINKNQNLQKSIINIILLSVLHLSLYKSVINNEINISNFYKIDFPYYIYENILNIYHTINSIFVKSSILPNLNRLISFVLFICILLSIFHKKYLLSKNIYISVIFIFFVSIIHNQPWVSFFSRSSTFIFIIGILVFIDFLVEQYSSSKKSLKKFLTLLFFLVLLILNYKNVDIHMSQLNYNKNHMDYHLDIKDILKEINGQKVYVDTDESLFYYLYNNGLINNFFRWSLFSEKPKIDYYHIQESDILREFDTDLLLYRGDFLNFELISKDNYLKIVSYNKGKIYINDKDYSLEKGLNILNIDSNIINIKTDKKIRIIGLNKSRNDYGYNFYDLKKIKFNNLEYNNKINDCAVVYFGNILKISKCY